MTEIEGLEQALHCLEGKVVWSMGVAPPLGADFLLKAGARWRVPDPRVQRGYRDEGEVSLYVACGWTLEREGLTELSSAVIWATGDLWADPLERFEGQSIRGVVSDDSGRQVALTFEDGCVLKVNANTTQLEDHSPLFNLSTENIRFRVRKNSVELEPRFDQRELTGLTVLP